MALYTADTTRTLGFCPSRRMSLCSSSRSCLWCLLGQLCRVARGLESVGGRKTYIVAAPAFRDRRRWLNKPSDELVHARVGDARKRRLHLAAHPPADSQRRTPGAHGEAPGHLLSSSA